jgi:hypothetical protein
VKRGDYHGRWNMRVVAVIDGFVERAWQMLHEEDALLANDSQAIHEKIERAFGQFERGEG